MLDTIDNANIYKLKLFETSKINADTYMTRVPGGWIYEIRKSQANILTTVFVPFNNEYQNKYPNHIKDRIS